MKEIKQAVLEGERALYRTRDLYITDTVFQNGESPIKECCNIKLKNTMFKWKYPIWYSRNIYAQGCTWFTDARAGVWYSENIELNDCAIEAPKNFRRCRKLTLKNVTFPNADETLWSCTDVMLVNASARGDYFAMNTENLSVDGLTLYGNYPFDGCRNLIIENSRIISKDAFWNTENVTVRNCFISGEYLGWNSRNLVFENCTIASLQGLCYIDNLVMRGCKLLNTTLAFEYSNIDVQIESDITSVLNPSKGMLKAEKIGELILQNDIIQADNTTIICDDIERISDKPEWLRR